MQSRIILISIFILKCAILIPASWIIESEVNNAAIKCEDIQHKTKQPNSQVSLPSQDTTLSKETEDLVFSWVTKENIPHPQFEKIEWRIEVPANVQKSIDRWIKNNEKNTRQKPAINPSN